MTSNVELLIDGYAKTNKSILSNQIPNDVLQLILFFGIEFGFVISIQTNSSNAQIYDIKDNFSTIYNATIYSTERENEFNEFSSSLERESKSFCVSNNCSFRHWTI